MRRHDQRMPKLFWRLIVSASAAGVTFLLTALLDSSNGDIWQWTASIVIGSAALIVQYMVDLGERFERVDQRFAEIIAATELFSQVDGSVLRSGEVTRLVMGYTKVREEGGDIVQAFAEKELARLAKLMEGLSSGSADCPGENYEWLLDVTDCVKMTLDATSTSVDRDFWYSGPAERYLAAQEKAIKRRGVEIRRLFVVKEPRDVTASLRDLCAEHGRRGIDTRIAVRSLLTSNSRVNDFIIFDGELSYETSPDLQSNPDGTWLRTEAEHLEDRVNQFNELWAEAAPQPEPVPQPVPEPAPVPQPGRAPTVT
ncbi:hypothetical protein M2271_005466 [Streptomyces sp. LBL]|uniref:DUF6879 family protein n=1 Tax=Streptomyces sp. LBL TaxID=2940562 RepID=UPI002476634A|nr:DUF6879 family protein [Streptomyces sp. LBL]MDH6627639.1 hypothetical protein [Streptomyces sp. LBL]